MKGLPFISARREPAAAAAALLQSATALLGHTFTMRLATLQCQCSVVPAECGALQLGALQCGACRVVLCSGLMSAVCMQGGGFTMLPGARSTLL